MTTASGLGRSSSISSPIVPLPAITAGSWTGCTNRPSTPSTRPVTRMFHQSSYGSLRTRPPSRPVAAPWEGPFDVGLLIGGTRVLQGLADRLRVLGRGGPDGDLCAPGVGEEPGQGEAGHRGAAAHGHLVEPLERVEGRGGEELLVRLGALRHPRAGGVRLPAAGLPG